VDFGKIGGDNIAYRGKYGKNNGKNLLYCRTCGKRFAATRNSPLFGAHLSPDQVFQIVRHAAEGVSVRASARLLGISKAAVNLVILKAGDHCQKVFRALMSSFQLTEVQLDELRTFVKKTAADEKELEQGFGEAWIWTAIDTPTRLIVNFKVGRHYLVDVDAREMIQKVHRSLAGDKPLFVSDELQHCASVLEEEFSHEEPIPRTGKRGRPARPKTVIDDDLIYDTVKKTRNKGHIVKVERSVVFGTETGFQERLVDPPSNTINTAYVERSNPAWRLWDVHLTRKPVTFAKARKWLEA
jgi:IS1 family transposase